VKLRTAQLIAAGQALQALDRATASTVGAQKTVKGVDVDGVVVDAEKAQQKLAAAERQELKTTLPQVVDKMVEKAAPSVDKTVNVMGKVGLKGIANEVMRHTEHVARTFNVGITFTDGSRVEVPVQVTDRKASHLLQRLTLSVEAITVIPFSGMFVRSAVWARCSRACTSAWWAGPTSPVPLRAPRASRWSSPSPTSSPASAPPPASSPPSAAARTRRRSTAPPSP
jgi:hypothetical protein